MAITGFLAHRALEEEATAVSVEIVASITAEAVVAVGAAVALLNVSSLADVRQ